MCFGVHRNPEVPSWEFDLTDISVALHEKWKSSGSTYCSTLGLGRLSLNFQSALGHFGTIFGFLSLTVVLGEKLKEVDPAYFSILVSLIIGANPKYSVP